MMNLNDIISRTERKMGKSLTRVAFWLVPESGPRTTMRQLIHDFAERYRAPVFEPHVTLFSCPRTPGQEELAHLARLARGTAPLTLSVDSQAMTADLLAKTLYLPVAEIPALESLQHSLCQTLPASSPYQFEPHLSLLYQALTEAERQQLTAEVQWSAKPVRFAELRAMAIPQQLQAVEDFLGWQPLLVARLMGR